MVATIGAAAIRTRFASLAVYYGRVLDAIESLVPAEANSWPDGDEVRLAIQALAIRFTIQSC